MDYGCCKSFKDPFYTYVPMFISLLFTRLSWRGSVAEAEVERWLWMISPWGKAPAQMSTIWGDSDWKNNEGQTKSTTRGEIIIKRTDSLFCFDPVFFPSRLTFASCWGESKLMYMQNVLQDVSAIHLSTNKKESAQSHGGIFDITLLVFSPYNFAFLKSACSEHNGNVLHLI